MFIGKFENEGFVLQSDDEFSGQLSPIRQGVEKFFLFDDVTRSLAERYSVADFTKKEDDRSGFEDAQAKSKNITRSRSASTEDDFSVKEAHGFKSSTSELDSSVEEIRPIGPEEARRFCASVKCLEHIFKQPSMNLSDDELLSYFPRGLINSSIFCYLNSAVQVLGNIPKFSLGIAISAHADRGTLRHALSETYKYFWVRPEDMDRSSSDFEPIEATAVKSYFAQHRWNRFPTHLMQDAEEFLEDIVSELETEVALNQDFDFVNPVTEMFRGSIENPQGKQDPFYVLRLNIEPEMITSVSDAIYCYLVDCDNDYQKSRAKLLNFDQNEQVREEENSPPINASNEPPEENDSSFERFGIVDLGAECPPASGAAEDENMIADSDKKETFRFHAPEVLLLTLVRDSRISTRKYIQEDEIIYVPSEYPTTAETPIHVYQLQSMIIFRERPVPHYMARTRSTSGGWFLLNDHKRIHKAEIPNTSKLVSKTTSLVYVKVPETLDE